MEEIRKSHEGNAKLLSYLEAVREDVLANLEDFKGGGEEAAPSLPFLKLAKQEPSFTGTR